MIYNGGSATSDASWLATAGRRVLAYEDAGPRSEHVIFQSWMDKPDRALPETDPLTFTALVNRYVDDRGSLGELIGGGENLAFERSAKASSSLPDASPDRAVDGVADTIWNAGGGAPAWIEIDLGAATAIGEIRLLVAQSPPGPTHHRVTCRTSPNGDAKLLDDLEGATSELDHAHRSASPRRQLPDHPRSAHLTARRGSPGARSSCSHRIDGGHRHAT